MTAKEFLKGIHRMQEDIEAKKYKITVLRQLATNTTQQQTGMPRNPSSNPSRMETAVAKIVDLEAEVTELEQKRQRAVDVVSAMPNSAYCTLLLKRYVEEKPWEDIAAEMHCSTRNIYYMHRAALLEFQNSPPFCSVLQSFAVVCS